jgi:protein SCO1/2
MMLRRFAFLALLLLAVQPAAAEVRVVEPDPPSDLPAFQLIDHAGRPFTADSLKGRWDLILLGFTHCPDVCPFVLSNLAQLREEMSLRVSPENLPRVVFVAVDPQRDQPVLADYVAYFHPDFLGVTGSLDQLATFVEGVDGFARLGEPDKDGNYEVQHSAAVIVVAPDGRVHAKLSPPIHAGAAAEYLTRKQIAYRRNTAELAQ